MTDSSFNDLIYISQYAGMREDLVQAGGGNTSVKESDTRMLIKASGYQLSEVSKTEGYSVINPKIIIDFFKSTPIDRITKQDEQKLLKESSVEGLRPSIETFLHSLTDKVTIHSHPILVDILTSRNGGMEELKLLFPNALIVPYATPGIELAKEYFCKWNESQSENISIVFLQNHGLIVSAPTADEAICLNEEVLSKIERYLRVDYSKYSACTKIWRILQEANIDDIVFLMNDKQIYSTFDALGRLWNFCVCPDCIVYCGKKVLELKDEFSAKDVLSFCEKYGNPCVIFYKNNFYAIAPTVKKAKDIESLFAFSAHIALNNDDKEINFLSDDEQNFLLNWDAEKYRRNIK